MKTRECKQQGQHVVCLPGLRKLPKEQPGARACLPCVPPAAQLMMRRAGPEHNLPAPHHLRVAGGQIQGSSGCCQHRPGCTPTPAHNITVNSQQSTALRSTPQNQNS